MMDFLFFAKTFAFTLLIVLLMQIQIDHKTIEAHTMGWVQSSFITGSVQGVSRGAAKMVHDISHTVADSIHHNVNRNKKGDAELKRESPFSWTHSSKPSSADED